MSALPRSTSRRPPCGLATGSSVRRGELWRAPSSLRDRVILLVSSQTLIDQGVTMLYGVEADAENPGPLLLVVPVLIADEQRWLNIQRGLTRAYRGALTQSYGLADPAVLEQVDALLRVALDL
jgi:hypothetical protein